MIRRSLGTLVVSLCFAASFAPAYAQGSASANAAAAAAAAAQGHGLQPYDAFVKGATVEDGLLPIIKKDGKVFLVISPEQIGQDFIATSVPATGFGGFGPAPGEPYVAPARVLHFERVDNTIVLRWPNVFGIAQPDTPQQTGERESLPNSIIAVQPIVAADAKHVVISADAFLGDVANLSASINDPRNLMHAYHQDPRRTFFSAAKAFPKNDVLRVDQTWTTALPGALDNAPDPRSVEVQMTYNLIAAPADGYVPRYDDARVGFFSQPLLNFSTDQEIRRDTHYITRWNFGHRTSAAPFTATNPIVFYLSNDIPMEYRDTVKAGLLTWNAAFQRVGILNAVRVEQQPNDPSFDPDDIRHNMVRWIDTSNPQYGAEALLVDDPRTGEELNIGVNFDAVMGLSGRMIYKYEIAPARGLPDSDALERAYAHEFIRSIVLHESGHDMGLQHNFIGSEAYTAREIQSRDFTNRFGIANSVMEYNPLNLWPKGTPQGAYDQLVLGPYDYYAIRYGYGYTGATTADQERPMLQRWASHWSDPKDRFASDEDADTFAIGHSIDPRVVTYDLTSHPLSWCKTQLTMFHGLMNDVDSRFPQAGMAYDEARSAFLTPMRSYLRCATMPAHMIGGEYLSRAHKGDPGAGKPLQPVSRADELAAWNVLAANLFSDAAWHFNPSVLQSLTYSEFSSLSLDAKWAYTPQARHDVPVVQIVNAAQAQTLGELYSPLRLQRLDDMSTKYGDGRTMTMTDLFNWSRNAIFGDLETGKARDGVVRRNLQVAYAKMLASMWTAPQAGTPADAQALARLELTTLRHNAALGAERARSNELERAHLEALQAIADQALSAHAVIAPPAHVIVP